MEQHSIDAREQLMTVKEVCEYLRISRATLYTYIEQDMIPSYRVGKRGRRFKRGDVEDFVKKNDTSQ